MSCPSKIPFKFPLPLHKVKIERMYGVLLKLIFSKKATQIDKIFTVNLTLTIWCQIINEDFVNFCGLLRKHELYLENGPKKEERGLRNIHLKLLEYMCSITMLRMYIPTRTLNSIEILSLFSRVLVTSLFSTQIPNDFIQFKVSLDLKCLGQHLSSSDKKYSALIWTNL